MQQQPIDLANVRKVYFDTSAWNYVVKHPRRLELADAIKKSGTVVLASVISVCEILRISDPTLRDLMCVTVRDLHGEGHLLERPMDLATVAAEAFLRGEQDFILARTDPGEAIYSHLANPDSPPSKEIQDWLCNMDSNLERFIEKTRPAQRDSATQYCSPAVLEREDFLRILCDLPPTKHLNLSISQMKELCRTSDIWRSQAATLAYTIELSTSHAPKSKHGKKRPGGPDLWQTVYLGVSEIFVTSDEGQLKAACRASACLKYPRCVVLTKDFADGALRHRENSRAGQHGDGHSCRLCGSRLPTSNGMHVSASPS